MESLNDIVKRQTRTSTSGANTVTSSEGGKPPEVCAQCRGAGFVHPRQKSGGTDFARAVPCKCQKDVLEEERLFSLEKFSDLAPLARMTFDAFDSRRVNLTAEQRENLADALDLACNFGKHPQGWLV